MNQYSDPYSVLILDNASIHKGQYLLDICNAKGIHVEYLPPYSPDLNPVCNIILNFILFCFILFLYLKYFLLIDRTSIFLYKK